MAQKTAVLLVVGLSQSLIGPWSPNLQALQRRARTRRVRPVLPAVTCSVQASMLTGLSPREHGIVGNGWYNRELAEVQFWKQSNRLVSGEKVWEIARRRDTSVTCANLFWWYNMYSSLDYSVTPRPIYKADGRKLPDIYTDPPELRERLQGELGTFPLFHFWGPATSIRSSDWIAQAAMLVSQWHRPTLSLVYLPHLDYALQKLGPGHADIPKAVSEVDEVVGRLLEFYAADQTEVIVLSEYGIEPVRESVALNRIFREQKWLRVREEQGLELLDAGGSDVFAVADHQIAHVYVRSPEKIPAVAELCRALDGVELVLDRSGQREYGLDHPRSGELVCVAAPERWFSYKYWLDDRRAPDFARTVDIHRKPGYDPLELFIDPAIRFPRLKIARKLLARRLGMRTLLDLIPLDASLVRGSHGRIETPEPVQPLLISESDRGADSDEIACTAVRDLILESLFR